MTRDGEKEQKGKGAERARPGDVRVVSAAGKLRQEGPRVRASLRNTQSRLKK